MLLSKLTESDQKLVETSLESPNEFIRHVAGTIVETGTISDMQRQALVRRDLYEYRADYDFDQALDENHFSDAIGGSLLGD